MPRLKTKKMFIYIAVIGLLIFLHFTRILAPIENMIIYILNPLAGRVYSVGSDLRTAYDDQANKRDLLVAVKMLEEKVKQLTVENVKLKVLEEENRILRKNLKFLTKYEFNYVLANIVSQDISVAFEGNDNIIVVDKGKNDGLQIGFAAIDEQGVIVGKIVDVHDNMSKISLVTNSGCKLAAAVQNEKVDFDNLSRTIGIAEGELGLTIKMNFIPQSANINEGDIVFTSGLEENIPKGLAIGTITQVNHDSNEVWQGVVIEPLANLSDLTIVSILLP